MTEKSHLLRDPRFRERLPPEPDDFKHWVMRYDAEEAGENVACLYYLVHCLGEEGVV